MDVVLSETYELCTVSDNRWNVITELLLRLAAVVKRFARTHLNLIFSTETSSISSVSLIANGELHFLGLAIRRHFHFSSRRSNESISLGTRCNSPSIEWKERELLAPVDRHRTEALLTASSPFDLLFTHPDSIIERQLRKDRSRWKTNILHTSEGKGHTARRYFEKE